MLLNIELSIKVTNNGKVNCINTEMKSDQKVNEILAALEMAKTGLIQGVETYFKSIAPVSSDEFDQIYEKITISDLTNLK